MVKSSANIPLFAQVEIVYRKKHSSLHAVQDCSFLDWRIPLREKKAPLFIAGEIAWALLQSQMPERPGARLYALCVSYLQRLPSSIYPTVFGESFLAKLLIYEGVLHLEERCRYCEKRARGLFSGISLCESHLPQGGHNFSEEAWKKLLIIGRAKRYKSLEECREKTSLYPFLKRYLQEELR